MKFHFTIQCIHPETQAVGSWIFSGTNHRQPGTAISPVFPDVAMLFIWMKENRWEIDWDTGECRKISAQPA